MRFQGLAFRALRVSGFRVLGLEMRVCGFRVQGLQGLGLSPEAEPKNPGHEPLDPE